MADDSASSPKKRLKTTVPTTQIPSSKCKSKLEDKPPIAENSPSRNNCGICFVEDGKAIRGEIDCCDHYFCFLCIMEWSKTESRCPMCRRRFAAIRRPPKDGVFACERLIKVPVRDQAQNYGNTTGSFDPYADVLCNVCHTTKDDSLLLLCDLCDSASHTYCVGLGFTVPEGDWFCHDCTISRAEHAKNETNNEDDDQDAILPLALPKVVRQESHSPVVERSRSGVSSDSSRVVPPAVPRRRTIVIEEVSSPGTRTFPSVAEKLTASGARTLDRCRNVQSHIRALRDNWNALRSGSLSFSSSSSKPRCFSQKHEKSAVLDDRSGQMESSSSKSSQQSTTEDGIGSKDIDRAWKMFDIAKSKHSARGKIRIQSSKPSPSKASGSKEVTNGSSNHVRKNQQSGYSSVGKTGSDESLERNFFVKEVKKHRRPELEKEQLSRGSTKLAAGCNSGLSTTCLPVLLEPSLSKNTNSFGGNTCPIDKSISLDKSINQASSNIASEQNRRAHACSASHGTAGSFDIESEPSASSCKADFPISSIGAKNGSTSSIKHDDAKSEIQSLVKLNLKLLSRDKKLGITAFKEIARAATHAILAACGLEHQKKYGVYSLSRFECSHDKLSEQTPRSNLMPKSCRQCFNSFVKEVVKYIMVDKVDGAKLS